VSAPRLLSSKVEGVTFGEGVTIVEPVNLYGCKLSDNVFIGPFVELQSDVEIGQRSKVQSHTFICSLVKIGTDCFIGHGVMFINDRFVSGCPARGDMEKWESTIIGNNVSIGSGATILPITICDNAVIGAGAVVTKNITVPGVYIGNPAKILVKEEV
jgi:acetyltransferase-like isoleucine patch superfamily enzyme